MDALRRLGKILVSGVLFSLLGLGGILLSLMVLPVLASLPGGPERRRMRARRLIHHLFRAFVFALEASGILRVEALDLPGPEGLRGRLILANHPGYLDVVVIIALIPDAVCVVKEGVWNSLFFGRIVQEAGFVRNLDPERCLQHASEALQRGDAMILFPEGTRSAPVGPLRFRRGAAHVALLSRAEILPLIVTCEPPLLEKGRRWYHIPNRTCLYRVRAQAPIVLPTESLGDLPPLLAARQISKALEAQFNGWLLGIRATPLGEPQAENQCPVEPPS